MLTTQKVELFLSSDPVGQGEFPSAHSTMLSIPQDESTGGGWFFDVFTTLGPLNRVGHHLLWPCAGQSLRFHRSCNRLFGGHRGGGGRGKKQGRRVCNFVAAICLYFLPLITLFALSTVAWPLPLYSTSMSFFQQLHSQQSTTIVV